jgi:hypothetical protein
MIVLILAAGESVRWQGDTLKQLMPFAGETVLARMIRQAEPYAEVTVISHEPDIQAASAGRYYDPPNHRWLVETLLSTVILWDPRTVVLLGDVIYSDEAIQTIMSCDKNVTVYGNRAELFALSFTEACVARVQAVLGQCLVDAHKSGLGKLWQFYRAFCGFPLNAAYFEERIFRMIDDYTDDIDTLEDYRAFCEQYERVTA